MTNAALITELEKAEEGTRALSDEVLLLSGWSVESQLSGHMWVTPDGGYLERDLDRPHPTGNLQDAVNLVPEGEWWSLCVNLDDREICEAEVGGCSGDNQGLAATPALALCICILKAMAAPGG